MHKPIVDRWLKKNTDPTLERAAAKYAAQVGEKALVAPALLYLTAHRPLAFIASQFLQAADPLIGLFDLPLVAEITQILNAPDGIDCLEQALLLHSDTTRSDGSNDSRTVAQNHDGAVAEVKAPKKAVMTMGTNKPESDTAP